MTILVDRGELRSGIVEVLVRLGADVDVCTLAAGDFEVGDAEIVERKTVADLHRSIQSGRLWRQLEGMRSSHSRAWLLVEGMSVDAGPVSPHGVRGALLAVVETGVPIIWSRSVTDSAEWLLRLARRSQARPPGSPHRWMMRAPRRAARASSVSVLCSVPGISPRLARALLIHFGSIEKVAAAPEQALREVDGIGVRRARVLRATLASCPPGTSRDARSARPALALVPSPGPVALGGEIAVP